MANVTGSGGIKHGEGRRGRKTAEYNTWVRMRSRCNSPKDRIYSLYGGRGIKICERWNDYENFLADMGRRPDGHSLDRIDCNGDYEPKNSSISASVISTAR